MKKLLLGILLGLGLTTSFAFAASWNLPPTIQKGDLIVATSTTQAVRLSTSTRGSVLWMGPNNVPAWTPTSTLGIIGGSGVTTLATGTSGTIFNGNISGNTLTLNLPLASGTNTGQLQASDWTTFNNKQDALVSGTNIKTINGSSVLGSGDLSVSGGSGTISTSTPAQSGKVAIWTGLATLGNGSLLDNGTVAGFNATSSTVGFNIQGTAGTNDILNVASSSGTTLLIVKPSGNVGIGTSTPLGLLSVQGTSGNLLTLYNGATTEFNVTSAGAITSNGSIAFTGGNTLTAQSGATGGLVLQGNLGGTAGISVVLSNSQSQSNTSSHSINTQVKQTWAPTSGTGIWENIVASSTINQTGGASGIAREIYIAPIITKAADYRALETASYTYNIGTGYANGTLYQALFNPYTLASSTTGTVANAQMLTVAGAPIGGTNVTITSSTALTILSNNVGGSGTVTNAQGLWVNAPTGATKNYAAIFMGGNVGIGSSTPSTALVVDGSDASSTQPVILYVGGPNKNGGAPLGCVAYYDKPAGGYVYTKFASGVFTTSTAVSICQ